MKIWTANLYFGYDLDEKLSVRFRFQKEDREDYKINDNYKEWSTFENWVSYRVPMEIEIEERYGEIIVTQGFDRELTEDEQKEVKENMIDHSIKYLENSQSRMNKIYNEKLIFLNNQ